MAITHGVTCGSCHTKSVVCTPGDDFPLVGTRYRYTCPGCSNEREFAANVVTVEEDGCPNGSVEGYEVCPPAGVQPAVEECPIHGCDGQLYEVGNSQAYNSIGISASLTTAYQCERCQRVFTRNDDGEFQLVPGQQ